MQIGEKLNVESLLDSSTQQIYSSRLGDKIAIWSIRDQDNIDSAWETLHKILLEQQKTVGKRKIRRNPKVRIAKILRLLKKLRR
jgi:hypothetical protein